MTQHQQNEAYEQLLHLEQQLMDPALRKDRAAVSALLTEDFREFGSSGHAWSREAILDLLATESAYAAPSIEDFALQIIVPNVALVTYRAVRLNQATLRSSIWVHRQGAWQILFHQGTRMPSPESNQSQKPSS